MNHLPPVEALKGPALNQAVDDLMRDGVDSSAPKPDLLRQFHELVYITTMEEEGEVRIHPDEMTRIEKWKRLLKEAIQKAPENEVVTLTDKFRDQFGEQRLNGLSGWERTLLEEDLDAFAQGGDPIADYFKNNSWEK